MNKAQSINSHLLAIDFESWIFSERINKKKLSITELRNLDDGYAPHALNILLKTLKRHDQKITFFIVTKLEEVYPGIIEKIIKDGHEAAWHGHTHARIDSKKVLLEELENASKIIKEYKMKGFQAPAIFFFREGYTILKKNGFSYSTSIYGNPEKLYNFSGVYEIPVSASNNKYLPHKENIRFPAAMTVKNIMKFGIPYGSSFFWGILGKKYYDKRFTESIKIKKPVNMFIHEWQIITPQSRQYKDDVNFFWNPLFLPYKINVTNVLEHFLSNYKFQKFIDYVEKNKKNQ